VPLKVYLKSYAVGENLPVQDLPEDKACEEDESDSLLAVASTPPRRKSARVGSPNGSAMSAEALQNDCASAIAEFSGAAMAPVDGDDGAARGANPRRRSLPPTPSPTHTPTVAAARAASASAAPERGGHESMEILSALKDMIVGFPPTSPIRGEIIGFLSNRVSQSAIARFLGVSRQHVHNKHHESALRKDRGESDLYVSWSRYRKSSAVKSDEISNEVRQFWYHGANVPAQHRNWRTIGRILLLMFCGRYFSAVSNVCGVVQVSKIQRF